MFHTKNGAKAWYTTSATHDPLKETPSASQGKQHRPPEYVKELWWALASTGHCGGIQSPLVV